MALIPYKTPAQKKQERKQLSTEIKAEQRKGKLGKSAVAAVLTRRRKNAT